METALNFGEGLKKKSNPVRVTEGHRDGGKPLQGSLVDFFQGREKKIFRPFVGRHGASLAVSLKWFITDRKKICTKKRRERGQKEGDWKVEAQKLGKLVVRTNDCSEGIKGGIRSRSEKRRMGKVLGLLTESQY